MPAPKLTLEQLAQLEHLTTQYSDIEIAAMWNCKHGTVRYQRLKKGIPSFTERTGQMKDVLTGVSRRRGTHNQQNSDSLKVDYFHKIDTPEKAYWIGMLATDGCVSENSRIQLHLNYADREIVDLLALTLGATQFVSERVVTHEGSLRPDKTSHRYGLRFTSKQMAQDLALEGIVPKKTKTLMLSPCASTFPQGYLRGYLDGDGSVGKVNFHLCSGSEIVINQIQELIKSHTGYELYKREQVSKSTNRRVWVLQGVRKDQPVLEWLYSDLEKIPYMKRKYLRFSRYWVERSSSYWKDLHPRQ